MFLKIVLLHEVRLGSVSAPRMFTQRDPGRGVCNTDTLENVILLPLNTNSTEASYDQTSNLNNVLRVTRVSKYTFFY